MYTLIDHQRDTSPPWQVLITSILNAPPREPETPFRAVTQKMRNHCSTIRTESARAQRERLMDAILAVMTPNEVLATHEVLELLGVTIKIAAVRRRLTAMAKDGLVERMENINRFGLKSITWKALC